jgi:hypothetical protein
MKFWCDQCDSLVSAPSFDKNDEGEANDFNGVGEHTHCEVCGEILTLGEVRGLDYISARLDQNKAELNKHGARPKLPGQPVVISDINLLAKAQDDEKKLLHAHNETLELKHEGLL